MPENYLIHYGNKNSGRYPRGSGENPYQHVDRAHIVYDKVIKKGTSLGSVSTYKDSNKYKREHYKTLYTYKKDNDKDASIYKGPFSRYKKVYFGKIFDHTFSTTKDLKVATIEDKFKIFDKIMKTKQFNKDISDIKKLYYDYGVDTKITGKKDSKLTTYDKWKIFNHGIEYYNNYETTKKYIDELVKKYDATIDDNNIKIYNDAIQPLIIFNAHENLQRVKRAKQIKWNEIRKNEKKTKDYLRKAGLSDQLKY